MAQRQLTDYNAAVHDTTGPGPDRDPRSCHSTLRGLDTEGMEFSSDADGWRDFPHPAEITTNLDEDVCVETATLPEEVREILDEYEGTPPDYGEFMVMDAAEVYEYLAELQRQSDLHLENFYRRQLLVNVLSNGRRNGKTTKVSHYDKRWIVQWEVRRRIAARDIDEWKELYLTNDNRGLPNN